MPRQTCLLLCLSCASAAAQLPADSSNRRAVSALEGTFRDSLGHPISHGVISVVGTSVAARGDDSGFFHLDGIPARLVHFTAARFGYATADFELSMSAGSTMHVDVRLRRNVTGLASGADADSSLIRATSPAPSSSDSPARSACHVKSATSAVEGLVRDEAGMPIPFVNVSLEARSETPTISDRSGCFLLHAPAGTPLTVVFRRIGFREHREVTTVASDAGAFVDVRMSSVVATVTGVTITAQRDRALEQTGFYDRLLERKKGLGDGWFITPEDIERRNDNKVTHLVEGFPSIKLVQAHPQPAGCSDPRRQSACGSGRTVLVPMGQGGYCIMAVYVDGARYYLNSKEAGGGGSSAITIGSSNVGAILNDPSTQGIDEFIDPGTVAAIEVYPRAAQAPPQYQSMNGSCGIILIWTKR